MNELVEKIKACTKMSELDALRIDIVRFSKNNVNEFARLQNIFISQKNKIIRNGGHYK